MKAPTRALLAFVLATAEAAAQSPDVPPPTPTASHDAGVNAVIRRALTPAQEVRYQQALRAYRGRDYPRAVELFSALARENPREGVLGMVVASYASQAPRPELADRLASDADDNREDVLRQFVAGVVSHYAGHQSGHSRAEKRRLYEQTIRFLERCRPTYDFEPRLFIYLAVSHHRLGHRALAEPLIEQAVRLAQEDPDVYYCRAEIYAATDRARALADIDTYLRMDAANAARGAVVDQGKVERVRAMRDALAGGGGSAEELWDPVRPAWKDPGIGLDTWALGEITVGVLLLIGGGVYAWRRRRRGA